MRDLSEPSDGVKSPTSTDTRGPGAEGGAVEASHAYSTNEQQGMMEKCDPCLLLWMDITNLSRPFG